jgi:hypothetical protein
MATFSDSTGAFFDELSKIIESQQSNKEEGFDLRADRPYSSLLTQDEEPNADYSPMQLDWQEPEVITRSYA